MNERYVHEKVDTSIMFFLLGTWRAFSLVYCTQIYGRMGFPPGLTPIYSECDIGIVNSSRRKISIFIVSSCFNAECSVWRTNWCPNRSVSNKSVDHNMTRHSFLLLLSNWYLNKFAILLDQMTEPHSMRILKRRFEDTSPGLG